jgi:hypothetical protein
LEEQKIDFALPSQIRRFFGIDYALPKHATPIALIH